MVGDELLGLAAAQALITGLQVDILVLIAAVGVVVVVALIDRRVDTAQLVDRLPVVSVRNRRALAHRGSVRWAT